MMYILRLIPIILLLSACSSNNSSTLPNILLILVDDLGYDDLNVNNVDTITPTFNMDSIANEGVRFLRHYSDSVCSPSRSALLSGLHPSRIGFRPNGRGISSEVVTIADALKLHGYETNHVGKWHIGDLVRDAWPDRQGFDHWFGFLSQWQLADGLDNNGEVIYADPTYIDPWLRTDSGTPVQYQGHLTDLLTDHAVSIIENNALSEKPWFINLWYYAPHNPIEPGADYRDLYPFTEEGEYLALLNQLDDNIGRLMSALEETGQADNTLVVLASDNGGTNARRNNNYPFYGGKAAYFEGGIRTPLLMRWPKQLSRGIVVDEIVTIYDVFPSIMALIQLPIPDGVDGVDITPAISGEELEPRILFWDSLGYSILSNDGQFRFFSAVFVVVGDYLFDLGADNTGSLSVENSEVEQSLKEEYQSWYEKIHRVEVKTESKDESGRSVVTGSEMQRTPGFGGYTVGVGVFPDSLGLEDDSVIFEQSDVWSLSSRGGMLHLNIADSELIMPYTLESGCNSIIVAGDFKRKQNNWASSVDSFDVHVYINGFDLGGLQSVEGFVDDTHLSRSTYIGMPADGDILKNFQGNLSFPIFLNVNIATDNVFSVNSVHAELCPI